MQVSSYSAVNTSIQSHTDSAKDKAATGEQNKQLSSSLPLSKQLDVDLLLNTGSNTGKHNDSMAVFDQLLTDAYRKLSEQFALAPELEAKMSEVKGYNDGQPITAEKASNNILGFIERRIMLDKADGATQEELESRLAAGLAGFEKGFAQAKEQLEALSLLSPSIEADIGRTYDLVHSGIDKLKEKYLGATTETNLTDKTTQNTSATKYLGSREIETKTDDNTHHIAAPNVESSLAAANNLFAQHNNFSFDLKTLDGDTVTIRASAQEVNVPKYGQARSSNFDLQITGDLDEDELKAINDLLSQVNDLAGTFFSGDMSKAFEQALSVGYNSEEIAQFALTLTHSETQKVSNTYQQHNQEKPLAQQLKPISDFTEQLLAAIDNANHFDNPIDLIQQLASQIENLEMDKNNNESNKSELSTNNTTSTENTIIDTSQNSSIKFVDFVSLTVHLSTESTI